MGHIVQVGLHHQGLQVGEHPGQVLLHAIDGTPHLIIEQSGLVQVLRESPCPCKIEGGDVGHGPGGRLGENLQREGAFISTYCLSLHPTQLADPAESSIHPIV